MANYKTVYTEVEVEVNLQEFDTEDLVEELEDRGYRCKTTDVVDDDHRAVLEKIWLNRREGKDYQQQLDQLIYDVLGKVV